MAAFARVVVGVDGTEIGFEALRQALVLTTADSVVNAVTALDAHAAARAGFTAPYWTELLEQEAAAARSTAAVMLETRPGSTAQVLPGDPLTALRRIRDETDASLVALGGQHRSRLLGIALGGTSTELLHDGVCSVLIARPHRDAAWHPRRVVVGLDGSPSSLAALAIADDLKRRLDSSVEGIYASAGAPLPSESWFQRVDAAEEAFPTPALVDRSTRADLIVVGSRGLHGLRALGSVSERVAHRARCSVLVVHDATA